MTAFGSWLRERIDSKKHVKSLSDFSRQVNIAHSFVSHICDGDRKPPLEDELTPWLVVLGVPETEQRYVKDLAIIAHLPIEVVDRMDGIYAEHINQGIALEKLTRRVAEMEQGYRVDGPNGGKDRK